MLFEMASGSHVLVANRLLLLLLVALTPSRVSAQDVPTWLAWDDSLAVAGCRAPDTVVAAVEVRLGRPLGASARRDAAMIVDARLLAGRVDLDMGAPELGLRAELTLRRANGEVLGVRRIETRDTTCATLDEGLPLVIAMLVDLHEAEASVALPSVALPSVALPSAEAAPVRPAVVAPSAPMSRAEPATSEDGIRGSLQAGVSVDVGGLPAPGLAVELVLELGPRTDSSGLALSGMVRAAVLTPQTTRSVGEIEVWGARGGLGACLRADLESLLLGGCALIEAGGLHVQGLGFDESRGGDVAHAAGVALFDAVLVALSPAVLRLEVGASAPIVLQRFVYDAGPSQSALFVSSPVTFRAGLLLGMQTP